MWWWHGNWNRKRARERAKVHVGGGWLCWALHYNFKSPLSVPVSRRMQHETQLLQHNQGLTGRINLHHYASSWAHVFFLFFAVKGLSFSPWGGGYFYENQQHVLAINAQLFNHSKWLIAIKIVPSHFFQSANPWSSTADGSSKDYFIPQNKIKSEKSAAGFVTFWERFICSSGNVNTHLKIKWTSEQER